jgi:hypothetical protein
MALQFDHGLSKCIPCGQVPYCSYQSFAGEECKGAGMSWFSKLKNKVEMKILDVIIAKVLDKLKAKNPTLFSIIFLVATTVFTLSTGFLEDWERMKLVNPQYVQGLEGIESFLPTIASIGKWASFVVAALSGTRTTQIITQAKEKDNAK